jgi:hypothetical protein
MRPAPEGFDITCTIGRVNFSMTGERSPKEAAFLIIANHGADGEFHFPAEEGGEIVVCVDHHPA